MSGAEISATRRWAILHLRHREHGRSCAVPPASDRIVSINLAEAAEVTPRLAGYRYGE